MARPEAKIDLAELEKLCGMQCAGWGKGSAYVSSRLSPVSSLNSCTVYRRSIGAAWVSGHPAVLGFAWGGVVAGMVRGRRRFESVALSRYNASLRKKGRLFS